MAWASVCCAACSCRAECGDRRPLRWSDGCNADIEPEIDESKSWTLIRKSELCSTHVIQIFTRRRWREIRQFSALCDIDLHFLGSTDGSDEVFVFRSPVVGLGWRTCSGFHRSNSRNRLLQVGLGFSSLQRQKNINFRKMSSQLDNSLGHASLMHRRLCVSWPSSFDRSLDASRFGLQRNFACKCRSAPGLPGSGRRLQSCSSSTPVWSLLACQSTECVPLVPIGRWIASFRWCEIVRLWLWPSAKSSSEPSSPTSLHFRLWRCFWRAATDWPFALSSQKKE